MRDHADDDPKYAECGIKSDAHLSVPSAMYNQEVKYDIVLNKDTPVYLADNKVTKSFQRPRQKSTSVLNLPWNLALNETWMLLLQVVTVTVNVPVPVSLTMVVDVTVKHV